MRNEYAIIAKIKSEHKPFRNTREINVGSYMQEYACTVGELKDAIRDIPDNHLVSFFGDVPNSARLEHTGGISIMNCEMESEEEHKHRIDELHEKNRRIRKANEAAVLANKMKQYNRLKQELGL